MKEILRMIKQAQDKTEVLLKNAEDKILFSQKGYDQERNEKENYQEVFSLQKKYRLYEKELKKKRLIIKIS